MLDETDSTEADKMDMMNYRTVRLIARRLAALLLAPLLTFGVIGSSWAAPVETTGDRHESAELRAQGHDREMTFAVSTFWWPAAGAITTIVPPAVAETEEAKPHVELPVPAAIWMFGTGLVALGLARRRISAWRRRDQRRVKVALESRGRTSRHRLRAALHQRVVCRATARQDGDDPGGISGGAGHRQQGGPDEPDAPPSARRLADPMELRFAELAAALTEQPDVTPGRRFGMACIRYGKRPFLAHDEGERGGLAFRVGERGALRLLVELPYLEHWNPKQERQAKRSWLICRDGHGEVLVRLALVAYEQALRDAAPSAVESIEYSTAEPERA